jgi:DNA adenine methylase
MNASKMVAPRKLRPPVKRHGGKAYLARRIAALFPPHRVYLEPFLGGGSVLLNKAEADHEIACDLDADLIHLWRTIRDNPGRLAEFAAETPYDEAHFRSALAMTIDSDAASPTVWALRTLIVNRFSRGGLGGTFAWSERLRGGKPGDANAWDTIRAEIPAIAARVALVDFACVDGINEIARHDGPDTLTYCDPPYLHETRTTRDAYDHEMSAGQHAQLLDVLESCKGKVAISGYRSPLYDVALDRRWRRVDFDMPNHSGQGKAKQRRVECLWMNY